MKNISPYKVFKQVSGAIPKEFHKNIIIAGSLAAGFHFFGNKPRLQIRTKDIDCVLSPRIEAVGSGEKITQKLLDEGWEPRTEGDFSEPGDDCPLICFIMMSNIAKKKTLFAPVNNQSSIAAYPDRPEDFFLCPI